MKLDIFYGEKSKLISGRSMTFKKKDTQGIPMLKKKNGRGNAQSEFEKAEELNGQFLDVFTEREYNHIPLLD